MWTQIYLSREFPIIFGFFLFLVCVLVLTLIGIVLKIIDVRNNRKSRILLERLTKELFDEGDTTMKLFDTVVNAAGTPPQGNRSLQTEVLTRVFQEAGAVQTGIVERMHVLATLNAANRQHSDAQDFLKDLDSAITESQQRFEKNAPMYREGALGSAPETATASLEQQGTLEHPEESPLEVPPLEEAPAVQQAGAEEVPPGASVSAGIDELPEITEQEAKHLLATMKGVEAILASVGLNHGNIEYSFNELSRPTLESLKNYFRNRCAMNFATKEDKQLLQFLLKQ